MKGHGRGRGASHGWEQNTHAESSNICYNYFTKKDSCTGTKTWAKSYQFNGGVLVRETALLAYEITS